MKQKEKHEQSILRNQFWLSGLIALSLIIMQDFISISSFDIASWISVAAFAIAIPLMTGALATNFEQRFKPAMHSTKVTAAVIIGILSAYIGIVAAFIHISIIVAVLFVGSTCFAWYIHFSFRRTLDGLENQEVKIDPSREPSPNM